MQFTGATNSWTVQALSTTMDGIGLNYNSHLFNFPVAVQGAAAGSFFLANGGTAPIWSAQQETYIINRNGSLIINFSANTNTTPGAGAVDAILAIPYSFATSVIPFRGLGWFLPASLVVQILCPISTNSVPSPNVKFFTNANAGVVALSVLGAASTTLSMSFEMNIYFT